MILATIVVMIFVLDYIIIYYPNILIEVWNYQVTKSSYETELRKMTSHLELLTRNFL